MKLFYEVRDGDFIILHEEADCVESIGYTEDEYFAKLFCAAPKLLELVTRGDFTLSEEMKLLVEGRQKMKVGDKCEFQCRDNPWYPCTILYIGHRFVVIEKDGVEIVKYSGTTSFRPIREEVFVLGGKMFPKK